MTPKPYSLYKVVKEKVDFFYITEIDIFLVSLDKYIFTLSFANSIDQVP